MELERKKIFEWKRFISDTAFDELYPLPIQALSKRHWTSLLAARKAAFFLAPERNARILDIGSGVGKFCLAAAHYKPRAFFWGVEQRKTMVSHSEMAKKALQLDNVSFIYGNFTQLDFRDFDHFYFYNSFYENLDGTDKIDNSIEYSGELFNYYHCYLFQQLEQKPKGTRIATFHGLGDEVPRGYHLIDTEMNGLLKFWIKTQTSTWHNVD
jgi:SAM-dependent methyltransferase